VGESRRLLGRASLDEALATAVLVVADSPHGVSGSQHAAENVGSGTGLGLLTTFQPSSPPCRVRVTLSPKVGSK
jgi:hypothetical protein